MVDTSALLALLLDEQSAEVVARAIERRELPLLFVGGDFAQTDIERVPLI